LKYEALEISEFRGPLKEKCITVSLGPFESRRYLYVTIAVGGAFESKVDTYTLQLLLGPFESNVGYFTHYSCKGGLEASASLTFP